MQNREMASCEALPLISGFDFCILHFDFLSVLGKPAA
jgi:hypothetical protein